MAFAMAPDRMSFAVLGPGGVGGLLAALLSRGGDRVVVLHDSGLREIHVESKRFGDFTASVQTAPRLAEPVDAALVTVKATHLEEALDRMPAAALGDALVIPFLNGIEHVELLRSAYPASSVVPATIRIEPIANLAFIERAPETMETSMQRDQAAGRQIEIDALGGALLRRAAKAGIQVPVTERIVEDLKKRNLTNGTRGAGPPCGEPPSPRHVQ